MRHVVLILVILITTSLPAVAQDTTSAAPSTAIIEGDTLAAVDLRAVVIFPPAPPADRKSAARWDRLVYNVKKVYPYAKKAAEQLTYYRNVLDTIPGEKARKQYMKKAEKELQDKFGNEIQDLTFSQGKILIKLIYRETGNSTYDIVQQLRGRFTAFIWQTLARIFGYDLKTGYDPGGSDQAIEQIVLMIEAGAL
ncbi:MAG TPA: DUF4294 domain-containing protein [Bacteroidales bacterium]|nr:DUF4294 domain-containing protein [Bacteroidales bacterium]HPS63682.1 DUF4294 domain-containing protein [Bacteroidales bacterium]